MMSRLRQPIPKRETLSRSISNSTFGELRINSVERLQCTFAPFYRPLSSVASNRSHYHYSPPWGPLPKLKSLLFLSRCHQRCLISSRGNASSERIAAKNNNDNLPIWPILHTGDGHPLITVVLAFPAPHPVEERDVYISNRNATASTVHLMAIIIWGWCCTGIPVPLSVRHHLLFFFLAPHWFPRIIIHDALPLRVAASLGWEKARWFRCWTGLAWHDGSAAAADIS